MTKMSGRDRLLDVLPQDGGFVTHFDLRNGMRLSKPEATTGFQLGWTDLVMLSCKSTQREKTASEGL